MIFHLSPQSHLCTSMSPWTVLEQVDCEFFVHVESSQLILKTTRWTERVSWLAGGAISDPSVLLHSPLQSSLTNPKSQQQRGFKTQQVEDGN